MRSLSRLVATVAVAVATASLFVSAAPAASAATGDRSTVNQSASRPAKHHRKEYVKPTVSFVRAECRHQNDGDWVVSFIFEMRGGRYSDNGNWVDGLTGGDPVWRGGRRTFTGQDIYQSGWGRPGEVTIAYTEAISPIETRDDMNTWELLSGNQTADANC